MRLLPLILLIGYGWLSWHLSARRTAQMLDRQSRRLDDGPLRDSLDRLANALNIPHIAAFVFETEVWNGLAAPDGRIFITRGFLQARDRGLVSNAELTSVLAHELGHVALGHARRRMIDFTGQNAVMVLLGGLAARVLPGVGPLLINLAGRMLAAHLSKRDEFEQTPCHSPDGNGGLWPGPANQPDGKARATARRPAPARMAGIPPRNGGADCGHPRHRGQGAAVTALARRGSCARFNSARRDTSAPAMAQARA